MFLNASDKKTSKLVKRGVLLSAPFLLFFAAAVLASVWMFQTFIANSVYYDAIIDDTPVPDGSLIVDKTAEQQGTQQGASDTAEGQLSTGSVYPDTFPTIRYGKKWAVLNVEGWEETDVPVYFGSDEELLKKGACMNFKSSFCGKGGRTILSAHVTREFYEIEDIKYGDIITMDTVYGTYKYEVYRIFRFDYNDPDILFAEESDQENILFLYTCYPRKNGWEFKEQRIAVIGRMIEGKDWSVADEE